MINMIDTAAVPFKRELSFEFVRAHTTTPFPLTKNEDKDDVVDNDNDDIDDDDDDNDDEDEVTRSMVDDDDG